MLASFVAFFIHPIHQRGYFNPGGGRIIPMYPSPHLPNSFWKWVARSNLKNLEKCSIS
jgi:hypothetical protein